MQRGSHQFDVPSDPRDAHPTRATAHGFVELFPVQAAVWRQLAGGRSSAHDMCIAAPTGSGKTLAYALPVLHGLLQRHVRFVGVLDDIWRRRQCVCRVH